MSDETVKRYTFFVPEGDGYVECVRASDYDALHVLWGGEHAANAGLKKLIENIRSALGIGPGTDVVRAAERARAERDEVVSNGRALQLFMDRFAEIPCQDWHFADLRVRINGEERYYQADWLKDVYRLATQHESDTSERQSLCPGCDDNCDLAYCPAGEIREREALNAARRAEGEKR